METSHGYFFLFYPLNCSFYVYSFFKWFIQQYLFFELIIFYFYSYFMNFLDGLHNRRLRAYLESGPPKNRALPECETCAHAFKEPVPNDIVR